jgi:hypothetical protein
MRLDGIGGTPLEEEEEARPEAGPQGILGDASLAFGRARAGGLLGVAAVGFELGGGHGAPLPLVPSPTRRSGGGSLRRRCWRAGLREGIAAPSRAFKKAAKWNLGAGKNVRPVDPAELVKRMRVDG